MADAREDVTDWLQTDRSQKPPDRLNALLLVLIAMLVAIGTWCLIDGARHRRADAPEAARGDDPPR